MPTASHPASIRQIFRQTEFICDRVSRVRVPWQTLFAAPQDTNIASYFIKGHTAVRRRLAAIPMDEIAISSVTEGELRYGVARLPDHARLKTIVEAFLIRVNVQPWDSAAARCCGPLRAGLEAGGAGLANLDPMIAAHALARGSILITHDKAFARVKGLALEDWTK